MIEFGTRVVIGTRVNNFDVQSLLGEGGMGAVYLAVHPVLNRKAAIKVLHTQFARDPEIVSRFMNEARAANTIGHPNIIDILDQGTLPDGRPYMMMEFLDGETLTKRVARLGPLPVPEVLAIARQVTSALDAAHGKGILHRDLKPDNLFLLEEKGRTGGFPRVKVLDFGVAKLRDRVDGSVKTRTGTLLGTPLYMSPEQCRGETHKIDARTDIYSLGVILWEILCGVPPLSGQTVAELIVAQVSEVPAPPSSKNAKVPSWLDRVLMRVLEKDPEKRFATMAELEAALAAGDGSAARPGKITALGTAPTAIPPAPQDPVRSGATRLGRTGAGGSTAMPARRPQEASPSRDAAPRTDTPPSTTTFRSSVGEAADEELLGRPRRRWLPAAGIGGAALLALALFVGLRGGASPPATPTAAALAPTPATATSAVSPAPAAAPAPVAPSAPPQAAPSAPPPAAIAPEPPSSAEDATKSPERRRTRKAKPSGAKRARGNDAKPASRSGGSRRRSDDGEGLMAPAF